MTATPDLPEVPDDLSGLGGFPDDLSGLIEIPDDLSGLDRLAAALSEPTVKAGAGDVELPAAPDLPDDLLIPDDLSGLTKPARLEGAVLVTPIDSAKALAATCSLEGIAADVVESEVGALVVLRDLDGDALEQAATTITSRIMGVLMVLVTRRQGQVTAMRFANGESHGEVSLALLLANAPEEVEDLLLGPVDLAALKPIDTAKIGRAKALWMLGAVNREMHRERMQNASEARKANREAKKAARNEGDNG
ncbi:MAG: hypothetical protein FWD83_02225 [Promicromonosporaceae bacterium]|nr:hypothetical protein [Promicromonosporaceae bacterium]